MSGLPAAARKTVVLNLITIILSVLALGVLKTYPAEKTGGEVCANSLSCIKDLSGEFNPAVNGLFHGRLIAPQTAVAEKTEGTTLGENTGGEKSIRIDLSNQKLFAYEGARLVFEFPVSTGKWYPTPTGEFRIWIKLRYTRMEGGNPAINTYYNLPNVPYTMYFYNNAVPKSRGFGIHGAYWHNNFGHPMSHGCVNMRIEDAAKLYHWASPPTEGNVTYASGGNPGTPVIIYGKTPKED